MKPILIFDGIDKQGKDTLIAEFHKATGYIYPVCNRFTLTSTCYGKYRKRPLPYSEYAKINDKLASKAIIFYLKCGKEETIKRILKHDEKDIKESDINKLYKVYEDEFNNTSIPIVKIDTSKSISECIKTMKSFIKTWETNKLSLVYESILNRITHKHKHNKFIGKEIINAELEFDLKQAEAFNQIDYVEFNKRLHEYDAIVYGMKNEILTKKKIYDQHINESRQYVYTLNACITSVQCLYRLGTLYFIVNMRSSDIKNYLPYDIAGLTYTAKILNRDIFKAADIKFKINIGSLHLK
jgi:hypothetical protein|tara:strand:- start:3785 stop:4675 length:891 start_codon:yes stop_codon:yes gene_type:complete